MHLSSANGTARREFEVPHSENGGPFVDQGTEGGTNTVGCQGRRASSLPLASHPPRAAVCQMLSSVGGNSTRRGCHARAVMRSATVPAEQPWRDDLGSVPVAPPSPPRLLPPPRRAKPGSSPTSAHQGPPSHNRCNMGRRRCACPLGASAVAPTSRPPRTQGISTRVPAAIMSESMPLSCSPLSLH